MKNNIEMAEMNMYNIFHTCTRMANSKNSNGLVGEWCTRMSEKVIVMLKNAVSPFDARV